MSDGRILVANHRGTWVVKMVGDVRMSLCHAIDQCLHQIFDDSQFHTVVVDLTEAVGIDSTSLGLLAKLSLRTKERIHEVPTLVSTNEDITRILQSMGFNDQIFTIVTDSYAPEDSLSEIPADNIDEHVAARHVLEAHQVLMELNENNKNEFRDLVTELERHPGCR